MWALLSAIVSVIGALFGMLSEKNIVMFLTNFIEILTVTRETVSGNHTIKMCAQDKPDDDKPPSDRPPGKPFKLPGTTCKGLSVGGITDKLLAAIEEPVDSFRFVRLSVSLSAIKPSGRSLALLSEAKEVMFNDFFHVPRTRNLGHT